ncbi:MAG TPA: D-alanine--D-alanine ligase [Polyangiaceae bacterium]|jgi:D-alanine-D-alanine ligase
MSELAPDARPRPPKRKPPTVAVLYNVDYEDSSPDGDPGYAARADVGQVAASIAQELDDGAHDVQLVPVDGDLTELRERLAEIDPDCAFNLCESLAGDTRLESAVPLVLELLGIPFTGSPPEALRHALYKDRVKRRLEAAGIPTPRACVMTRAADPCPLDFPLIVKPVREDGSVGISSRSVVYNEAELRACVGEIVATLRQPCLVEQFVVGRELNVALFGYPAARVLPLSEIDFSGLPSGSPPIVSYEAKWNEGSPEDIGTRPVLHPQLAPAIAARVRRVAVEAFRAVGMRDYGRVDVRLAPNGVPYVIDVNPNCDLSRHAGMARAAAAVGMDYSSLVKLLVRYALRRRRSSEARTVRKDVARTPQRA